jgi:hypothetical protein
MIPIFFAQFLLRFLLNIPFLIGENPKKILGRNGKAVKFSD